MRETVGWAFTAPRSVCAQLGAPPDNASPPMRRSLTIAVIAIALFAHGSDGVLNAMLTGLSANKPLPRSRRQITERDDPSV
jgi:hypothetical protein